MTRDQIAHLIAEHIEVSDATMKAAGGVACIDGIGGAADAIFAAFQRSHRIMGMSEAELAAELAKDGKTMESNAAECRAIFERAKAQADAALTAGQREGE